ncbi:DNA-3-methyladenine glycosylase [Aquibacillus sediminis]|uniref:DNA-3-methyladenine glycosylase n=1 Tax=Aquibacillus sediminis TaxID=2574734 RepID=UPI002482A27F|nr:DNA-3-methyladenine glycosylase [Aquibacillus sediminis]
MDRKLSDLTLLTNADYQMPTLNLAKALLGGILVKETPEGTAAGMIVETEAYIGPNDRAAHSYNNRRTKRTEVMFGPAGYCYTYTMHTHCLFNIVSGEVGHPEAVLIRAIQPYYNQELMVKRRPKAKKEQQLTNGPGKLTQALGIQMEDYGHDLQLPPLWIAKPHQTKKITIVSGPRIGIENSGEAKYYPWRFWIDDNPFLSR